MQKLRTRPRSPAPSVVAPTTAACARDGFTIAEVMMAAVVLALAIATSITTMQRGFLALDTARNVATASQIMQGELERLRLKDWSTISALTTGPVTIDSSFTGNPAIASRFSMTRNVADVHADAMKQITLTISWRSYDGRPISRGYTTYYGKNGLYDYFYNTAYPSVY